MLSPGASALTPGRRKARRPFPPRSGWTRPLLWQVDLADPRWDVAEAWAVLDPAERARSDRGTAAVRRRRVLLRAGLRRVLAELLCTRPDQVGLTEIGGRPILVGPDRVASLAASSRLPLRPLRPLRPVWLLPGGRP